MVLSNWYCAGMRGSICQLASLESGFVMFPSMFQPTKAAIRFDLRIASEKWV